MAATDIEGAPRSGDGALAGGGLLRGLHSRLPLLAAVGAVLVVLVVSLLVWGPRMGFPTTLSESEAPAGDRTVTLESTIRGETGDAIDRAVDWLTTECDWLFDGISDAIADFLNRPITEVLGDPDDPAVARSTEAVVDWVVDLARDPATHGFVIEKVEAGLTRASGRTWGELLEGVPRDRLAQWLVRAARSDIASAIYRASSRRLAAAVMERPIGRPARLLPAGTPRRIQDAVSEPLWQWLQAQIPSVVRRLDVARRVEDKVREFPVERMERLVRRVTGRELRTIIYLGYVLGAVIGGLLVILNTVWT